LERLEGSVTTTTWGAPDVWGGGAVWGGGTNCLFLDETGLNPLPAGILVSLFSDDPNVVGSGNPGPPFSGGSVLGPGGAGGARGIIDPSQPYGGGIIGPNQSANILLQATMTLVAQAWTYPGGYCPLSLVTNGNYTAAFGGSYQAPTFSQAFTAAAASGSTTTVTVNQYRSPSFSNAGYALEQTKRLVKGWFGDAARAPGGIAYAIAFAYGAALALLDGETQTNLGSMRLQSSQGPAIDSWAADMVGPQFPRFSSETDPQFISRLETMVARPRTTIAAIQALVQAFYDSIEYELLPNAVPTITVWDGMTQPGLAQTYGVLPTQFVIQVGNIPAITSGGALAFDTSGGMDNTLGGSLDVLETSSTTPGTTMTPPDPRLGQLVNLLGKGCGTVPLYLVERSG
jgi:hypothetical protein